MAAPPSSAVLSPCPRWHDLSSSHVSLNCKLAEHSLNPYAIRYSPGNLPSTSEATKVDDADNHEVIKVAPAHRGTNIDCT